MKSKFAKRLAALLLTLVMSLGLLVPGAFAAATVNKVVEKQGEDGKIVVTVYNQAPVEGNPGIGTGGQVSNLSTPVDGVGINALRIGSVVELTSTDTDTNTVSTQVAFGLTEPYISLLGLNTDNAIASNASTHYFAPTVVQDALKKVNDNETGTGNDQADIEDYLDNNYYAQKVTGEEGTDGQVTFSGLDYGLYLLAKSKLPADATTDLVPFLVSVPMYVENGTTANTWQTTVYAYPKVRADDITLTKTAVNPGDDGYVSSGDTIPFTISVTIPASQAAEPGTGAATKFTQFTITDTNIGGTLDIDADFVEVELNDQPLTIETEFTKTYDEGVLTIDLTDTAVTGGLAKLNNGLAKQQTLTITYNATVATDVATFSNKLTNTAALDYQREGMLNAETKNATVDLYTYGIDLTKTLSDSAEISEVDGNKITFKLYKTYTPADGSLANEIYVTEDSGNNNGYWVAASGNSLSGEMSVSGGGTTGNLTLYGLEPGTYYLKETATMDGYALLDEPIEIKIEKDSAQNNTIKATATINEANVASTNGVFDLSVENTKLTAGFALPQTGGAGTLAVTAIGLGLLCVAIVLLVVYRKKGNKNS